MQHFFHDDDEPPVAGSRPDRLSAVSVPQERVQRHTVEQMGDVVPVVPVLIAPCWGAARWAARSGAGSRSHLQFVCGLAASWPRASAVTSLGWRRSGKGQPSRWHVGGASSCGVVSRLRVRRSSPWRRFCLTSEEGPPPDQGGVQILVGVLGQVLVPQIHERIVAVGGSGG